MRKKFEAKRLRDVKFRVSHEFGGHMELKIDRPTWTYDCYIRFPEIGGALPAVWYCIRGHRLLDVLNQAIRILDDYKRTIESAYLGKTPRQWIRMTPPDYHRAHKSKPRVLIYRGDTYGSLILNMRLKNEVNWDAS